MRQRNVIALILAVLCTACGLFGGGSKPPKTQLEQLSMLALTDSNQTTATAIDVLFVYDESVLPLLPKDAAAWFSQRETLKANLWQTLDVVSEELPPAYLLRYTKLPARSATAVKVIAYANYLAAAGRAPIDLTARVRPRLTLATKAIWVLEDSE